MEARAGSRFEGVHAVHARGVGLALRDEMFGASVALVDLVYEACGRACQ